MLPCEITEMPSCDKHRERKSFPPGEDKNTSVTDASRRGHYEVARQGFMKLSGLLV